MKPLPLLVQYLPFNPDHSNNLPTVFPSFDLSSPLYLSASNMEHLLFPEEYSYSSAWSTSSLVHLPHVQHIELSDAELGVHAVDTRTKHTTVAVPDIPYLSDTPLQEAQKAWEAFYPNGSINPSGKIPGGFGFYLSGPKLFSEKLSEAKEVLFGYSVLFQEDWDWAKGGKLPGIFGGAGNAAYHCTGGRQTDRDKCFNLRLMWRSTGAGELYAYIPPLASNIDQLLAIPPKSIQNPDYGFSVGRGSFNFTAGRWNTVTERVKLNDIGISNGEVEVRLNGKIAIYVSGLSLRNDTASVIQGLHFQTFFGGSSQDWASPKDQNAWFADISGALIN